MARQTASGSSTVTFVVAPSTVGIPNGVTVAVQFNFKILKTYGTASIALVKNGTTITSYTSTVSTGSIYTLTGITSADTVVVNMAADVSSATVTTLTTVSYTITSASISAGNATIQVGATNAQVLTASKTVTSGGSV